MKPALQVHLPVPVEPSSHEAVPSPQHVHWEEHVGFQKPGLQLQVTSPGLSGSSVQSCVFQGLHCEEHCRLQSAP